MSGGAVWGSPPDEAVVHYGNPATEGRALEGGSGLVELSHLEVVSLTGPERLTWLHRISSQHVCELAAGRSTESLILDPHGHIEHAFFLFDDGATSYLISETAEALAAFLERMKFDTAVEIARPPLRALGALGPRPELAGVLGSALVTWRDPWPCTAPGSARYGPPDGAHPGAWGASIALVASGAVEKVKEAWLGAGGTLSGLWAWEAARIAAWRPRWGREVDGRSIPHELDWLRTAVHLTKGCYRGQETVARVVNLGRPPRRLVFLHLDGSEHHLPEPGAEILCGQRPVGHLTSVARHYELGPIALGLVRRSTDPAATLTVAGIAAAPEEVVTATGESSARPKVRPGAGLRDPRRREVRGGL